VEYDSEEFFAAVTEMIHPSVSLDNSKSVGRVGSFIEHKKREKEKKGHKLGIVELEDGTKPE
jgi:hypothetical protein